MRVLTDHVYRCRIPTPSNEGDEPVIVHLKAVKQPEYDGFMQEAQAKLASMEKDKWAEYNKTQMLDICRSKVVKVEGLFVDGKEVEDFDTFYANAPMDMASWVLSAILSEQMLMSNEVKNSEPV